LTYLLWLSSLFESLDVDKLNTTRWNNFFFSPFSMKETKNQYLIYFVLEKFNKVNWLWHFSHCPIIIMLCLYRFRLCQTHNNQLYFFFSWFPNWLKSFNFRLLVKLNKSSYCEENFYELVSEPVSHGQQNLFRAFFFKHSRESHIDVQHYYMMYAPFVVASLSKLKIICLFPSFPPSPRSGRR
jgi:hypothetical protein